MKIQTVICMRRFSDCRIINFPKKSDLLSLTCVLKSSSKPPHMGTTFYAICSREHILYRGTTLYTKNIRQTPRYCLCVCVCVCLHGCIMHTYTYLHGCIIHTYTYVVCVCVCVSFVCFKYTPPYPQTQTQTRKTETNERY
jgi:hypothetical protein